MQASNAAKVNGNPSKLVSKRLALKIWGTKQQSAKPGVSP
jgi:hypothetical protein